MLGGDRSSNAPTRSGKGKLARTGSPVNGATCPVRNPDRFMTIHPALIDAGPTLHRLGRDHPLLPIGIGVFLYSTGPVFVQASSMSGPVFSFWRLWFGVGVLGLVTLVDAHRQGRLPSPSLWRWPVGAGIAFAGHQLLLFTAVKATSVADVTLVSALSPIVTALLAAPVFHERPGMPFRLWSLMAMAGAGVVVFGASSGPQGDPVGMLLALANVVAFAVFFLLSKGSRNHLPVLPFLFGVFAVAAVFVSAYVILTGGEMSSVRAVDLVYAATVAAGPGFLGHFVSTWPLGWVPANVPPVMRMGIPVLAATWAWWLLGEAVTPMHVVGGAITLAGVAGALLSPSGRAFVSPSAPPLADRRPHAGSPLRPRFLPRRHRLPRTRSRLPRRGRPRPARAALARPSRAHPARRGTPPAAARTRTPGPG